MACLPGYSGKLLAGTVLGWLGMVINLLAIIPLSCWLLCIYEQPEHTAWTDNSQLQVPYASSRLFNVVSTLL